MKDKNDIFIKCIMAAGVVTVIAAMIIVFGKFGRMVTVVRADNASITGVNTDKTGDAENTGSVDKTDDAENIGKADKKASDSRTNSSREGSSKTDNKDIYIPDSLLELKGKYPETADFVDSYAEYQDTEFDMDISDEIVEGEIPLFIQWDKRWGYCMYGNDFFGVNGCGPTCLAMVVCGLTNDSEYNPYDIAMFSMSNDYYISGQGTSWNLMTEGARNLGLTVESGNITQWYIEHNLSSQSPMICSMEPGDFTYTGHFIVLTGIDEDGKIIVNDPNSYINSKKHWEISDLLPQIKSIWCYRR